MRQCTRESSVSLRVLAGTDRSDHPQSRAKEPTKDAEGSKHQQQQSQCHSQAVGVGSKKGVGSGAVRVVPHQGDVVIKAPGHGWNSGMVLEGRGWRSCFQRSLRQPPISTQHLPPAKANQKPEGNGASGWSPWDIECPCYHVSYPKCSHSWC